MFRFSLESYASEPNPNELTVGTQSLYDAVSHTQDDLGFDEDNFVCILPFGLTDEIDLTEWVADTPDREEDGRVRLVKDWEADSIVVELVSLGKYNDVSMSFPSEDKFIGTELPLLVLQLKNLGRFTGLRVEVLATNKKTYYIESSNRQSLAKLTDDTVSIPLELTEGWNSVVIDVPMLLGRAFSVDFKQTNRVTVFSNCRLRRVFFCDQQYRDAELPPQLRVFPNPASTQT